MQNLKFYHFKLSFFILIFAFCIFLPSSGVDAGTIINRPLAIGLNQGLVGHWTFDWKDMATSTALDISGKNNHGVLTNGPTRAIGRIGQALEFDGTDDRVVISDSASLYSASLTISMWVKVFKNDNENAAFASQDSGGTQRAWIMSFDTANDNLAELDITTNGSTLIVSPQTATQPLIGSWHHYVGVVDDAAKLVRYFVDGKEIGSGTSYTGTLFNSTSAVEIGRFNAGGAERHPQMLADDVRIYNRALSPDEIKRLYNMGR